MEKGLCRIHHVALGLFTGVIATYVILRSNYINNQSVLMLLIFNFLFSSLLFPLDGKLTKN